MKKFLTITCAAVACTSLALGLAACGDKGSTKKVSSLKTIDAFYEKYEAPKAFTKAEKVTDLAGYQQVGSAGNFVKLAKYNDDSELVSIAFLNKATGKVFAFDETDTDTVTQYYSFNTVDGSYDYSKNILKVTYTHSDSSAPDDATKNYVKYSYYDAHGVKIAEYDKSPAYASASYNYENNNIMLNIRDQEGNIKTFYFDEDLAQVSKDPVANLYVPGLTVGEYVQEVKGENGGYLFNDRYTKSYVSYDKELNVKHTLDLPSYAYTNAIVLFDNGNYMLQYAVGEAMDASKYDFMDGEGCKYSLTTVLVDVEKGKTKELDCKFVLSGEEVITPAMAEEAEDEFTWTEGIAAYTLGIGEITSDKQVDYAYRNTWFGITETGEIKKANPVVAGMEVKEVKELSTGNLAVEDTAGRTYIVSKTGEILKEVNMAAFQEAATGGYDNYMQIGNDLYDSNFEKVYTLAKGYTVAEDLGAVLLIKQYVEATDDAEAYTKTYMLKNGTATLIADESKNETVRVLEDEDDNIIGVGVSKVTSAADAEVFTYTCTYYNTNGDTATIDNQIAISEVLVSAEDFVICTYEVYDTDGETVKEEGYIKLSK